VGQLRTLLLATVTVAVSTVTVQAADLGSWPRVADPGSYHHHHHRWQRHLSDRCAFVEGVRGATPLTVPFFAGGWSPGPTYYVGWRRCTCCVAVDPVVSVNY
jgi:hypothetical protein